MPLLVQQGQGTPPQDEGGPCGGGVVGRGSESRFMVGVKRHDLPASFRCEFRTYVDEGVWCVCETTDLLLHDFVGPLPRVLEFAQLDEFIPDGLRELIGRGDGDDAGAAAAAEGAAGDGGFGVELGEL
jgi:hypothetical protein